MEIIKSGYALPQYPDEIVRSFERLHSDVMALRESGYLVEVLDASLGGKYPVTAISLINPENSSLIVSFGAHPILEVSLERTMTELMQGRGLDDLDAFEVPTFNMSSVSDSSNLESHFIDSNGKLGFGFLSSTKSFPFAPWGYQGEGCEAEYDYLTGILDSMGKEMYLREYNYLGFYSCQMIIPGVSEIYPIDDLIHNNRNSGKLIRDMVLHSEDYEPEVILEAIESLNDLLDVGSHIGVIFENRFTMLEFRAQLHLILGNTEDALASLEFGTNRLGHIVAELIRLDKEGLVWEEYEEALYTIFGRERVERALRIVRGEDSLVDTTLHSDHQGMLAMYDRLDSKKQTALFALE